MSRYLSLVVIELKKPGVPARAAFDENLTHHKQRIPALFWFNALLIASNGTDSRGGEVEGLTYGPVVTGNMEIRNLVQP